MTGKEYVEWVAQGRERRTSDLMKEAGFIAK